jgi:heptaprenyl diphosphate synthase
MDKEKLAYKKLAYMGLFCALAILMGYIEAILPIHIGIPGVKLGIVNIIIIFVFYTLGWKEALTISVIRIFVVGFLFGNLYSILFSLAGGVLSFLVMLILKKFHFHILTVSIAGGITHNLGQLLIASFVVQVYSLMYFMPIMIVAGVAAGAVIGYLGHLAIKRLAYLMPK